MSYPIYIVAATDDAMRACVRRNHLAKGEWEELRYMLDAESIHSDAIVWFIPGGYHNNDRVRGRLLHVLKARRITVALAP